jgi:hypothetical protein
MANIIRRPIIVFSLLALSDHLSIPINFAGIYLPFFSLPEETDRTPIFVAYLGGSGPWGSGSNHFVPLVCQRRQQDSPSTRISLQVFIMYCVFVPAIFGLLAARLRIIRVFSVRKFLFQFYSRRQNGARAK